jgi:C4-dicarboxylate-specific signal transduction histidine kinase
MGLAIVWRVLHEHRGTIAVTMSEEGGACFTVRLPRATTLATSSEASA